MSHADKLRHAAGFADTQEQEWTLRNAAAHLDKLEGERDRLRVALEIAEPFIDINSGRGAAASVLAKQTLAAVRVE